jgi:DNA replication and repair protein RecF
MGLLEINLTNIRCVEQAELELPRGLSLIWGPNGSGKTSVLEAIFMLGRGRSFRIRNSHRLIRYGQDHLRVSGHVSSLQGGTTALGFEMAGHTAVARIGGRTVESFAELSQAFPVQVIDPGVHRLIEESGHRRRRWLDWAVFHVEPLFIEQWRRYVRALKQRNAALKMENGEIGTWETEVARLGESIAEARRRVLEQLQPYWQPTVLALSGLDVEMHYLRGWNQELTLREALVASRTRDQAYRLTHAGPHRADVALRLNGHPARDVLSRGQQKLVAAAMNVAQLQLLRAATDLTPTLLLDDPAAELDGEGLERLINQVTQLRCQLVATSLHAQSRLFGSPERTFRMEQGRVQPV